MIPPLHMRSWRLDWSFSLVPGTWDWNAVTENNMNNSNNTSTTTTTTATTVMMQTGEQQQQQLQQQQQQQPPPHQQVPQHNSNNNGANNVGNPNSTSTQSIADYLAQLLKDKKALAAFPNVFLHVERLLDDGKRQIRKHKAFSPLSKRNERAKKAKRKNWKVRRESRIVATATAPPSSGKSRSVLNSVVIYFWLLAYYFFFVSSVCCVCVYVKKREMQNKEKFKKLLFWLERGGRRRRRGKKSVFHIQQSLCVRKQCSVEWVSGEDAFLNAAHFSSTLFSFWRHAFRFIHCICNWL